MLHSSRLLDNADWIFFFLVQLCTPLLLEKRTSLAPLETLLSLYDVKEKQVNKIDHVCLLKQQNKKILKYGQRMQEASWIADQVW